MPKNFIDIRSFGIALVNPSSTTQRLGAELAWYAKTGPAETTRENGILKQRFLPRADQTVTVAFDDSVGGNPVISEIEIGTDFKVRVTTEYNNFSELNGWFPVACKFQQLKGGEVEWEETARVTRLDFKPIEETSFSLSTLPIVENRRVIKDNDRGKKYDPKKGELVDALSIDVADAASGTYISPKLKSSR